MYRDDQLIVKSIWDSEQNWYNTQEGIILEKEENWSVHMREEDRKLTLLQSSES